MEKKRVKRRNLFHSKVVRPEYEKETHLDFNGVCRGIKLAQKLMLKQFSNAIIFL